MSCREGAAAAAAVAAVTACTSRSCNNRGQIVTGYEDEISAVRLPMPCDTLFDLSNDHSSEEEADKRDRRNIGKNENLAWTGVRSQTSSSSMTSGKNDDIAEQSVAEKFSADFEKWLKTRTEPTSMDLDATKMVEGVDRYLSEEELSHSFLGKDPYGLSIDIDLPSDKKGDLHLTSYDPILQDELPSEKLLPSCEKVDDEYILSEFQLYHLDPLTLSPDDMMVAGEILPPTSNQSMLHAMENHQEVASRTRITSRMEQQNSVSSEKSTQINVNEMHVDLSSERKIKQEEEMQRKKKEEEEKEIDTKCRQQEVTEVRSQRNPSELFMEVLAPIEESPSNSITVETNDSQGTILERLKLKATRMKLEPRIIKKRQQMTERSQKKHDKYTNDSSKNFADDGDSRQDPGAMAVVAISTDKTSNTTQIVINTGTERQIYQGKTSELIEATQGNLSMLPKIDTSAAVWNTTNTIECNDYDVNSSTSNQYEIVISNALEELGITDDSLQPVCVTEHDKVWFCPRNDCNRQFGRLYTLKGHLLAHYGVRPFKCDFEGCTWAFYSEFKLKRHKETHLKRKDYVCEVDGCNRRFTTVYNLWSHTKLHSRPNHIVCQVPDCDEKFQTKRALELHMKSHDQRHAPYVCQHEGCGKRYYSSNALTSHQRSHSYKEVDVKCSWPGCGKVFDKPCRLKAHTRSHTGCKPYPCTYQDCKWAFSSSSKLKRHQKKHTNERKFACDVPGCGKAFMRSEHLKEHRLTHTEGRYFRCFVCDARFSAKSSLYVHIKKHQTKTTEEVTNVIVDDVLEFPTGQKRARTKESHYSRVKPINVKSSSRRYAELTETLDTECFRSEKEKSNAVLRDNIEQQPDIHQMIVQSPTRSHADQLRTVYYCPIESCTAYLYGSEASLQQHALKAHGIAIVQRDDDDSLEKDSSSNAIMDYVLYTVPSLSSSSPVTDEQMIMVMTEDARTVHLNAASPSMTTDRCLPEPEPPPPLFNNAVLTKSTQPLQTDEQRITQDVTGTSRSKDHGSARTDLTLSDVFRLKMKSAPSDADYSVAAPSDMSSDTIALGASELCESLLLTEEELPSMYYQDDAAGAEYQVLLLDSNPLAEGANNLRGLE